MLNKPNGRRQLIRAPEAQTNRTISSHSHLLSTLHFLPDQVSEVQTDVRQHLGMVLGPIHTQRPHFAVLISAAELASEDDIERLDLFLGPLDTRTHHHRGEAALEAADRVADDGEVDERQFPDVEVEVSLKDALSEPC